ncbi:MAG: NUDIX domain-containing protein [Bacteroidetes bacterium]|nr:MAG: NUDIX domain-containing protein [Bacteroidota bacterium]
MPPEKQYYQAHPTFHVAVDSIIFGFDQGELKLLIHKRQFEPARGEWSLFGGFVQQDESLDEAASRILSEHTGLRDIYMEELHSYGEVDRDPAGRVISVAYFALIPAGEFTEAGKSKSGATWVSMEELPSLIMDHNQMVEKALRRLKRRAATQPIGFELLPGEFTMPQLQALYEAIYQSKLDKRNFRKKILAMEVLIKLDTKDKSSSKKGAYLYRFDQKKYKKLVEGGYNFTI